MFVESWNGDSLALCAALDNFFEVAPDFSFHIKNFNAV
jgi:hypothetical protein